MNKNDLPENWQEIIEAAIAYRLACTQFWGLPRNTREAERENQGQLWQLLQTTTENLHNACEGH
jgi:hypothetical protein